MRQIPRNGWNSTVSEAFAEFRQSRRTAQKPRKHKPDHSAMGSLTDEEITALALCLPSDAVGGYVVLYRKRGSGRVEGVWSKSLFGTVGVAARVDGRVFRTLFLTEMHLNATWDRQGELSSRVF